MRFNLLDYAQVGPLFISCLLDPVAGQEHKHATRRDLSDASNGLAELAKHIKVVAIIVAEVKGLARLCLRKHTDEHLLLIDDMWALELLVQWNTHLSRKAVHRGESARGEDD